MPRVIAIGDIHGCSTPFDALIAAIKPQPEDTFVILGDMVDRGPDSRGILDRMILFRQKFNVICLRGNHELMMVRSRTSTSERKMWTSVGGAETMASYSPVPGRYATMEQIPEAHWQFLQHDCTNWHETERVLFVHANMNTAKPIEQQSEEDLFWNFLDGPIVHPEGKTVVCGHTSQKSGQILDWQTTVCIDTAAYKGMNLTALDVSAWHYWQANILGKVTEGDLPAR